MSLPALLPPAIGCQQLLPHLHELLTKPHPHEAVQQLVDAAVRQAQALRNQRPHVQGVVEAAARADHAQPLQAVGQPKAVVGRPAQQEDGYQGYDEPQGLALLPAGGMAQGAEDAHVTVEHDQQGEPEAHHHGDQLQAHLPGLGVIEREKPAGRRGCRTVAAAPRPCSRCQWRPG